MRQIWAEHKFEIVSQFLPVPRLSPWAQRSLQRVRDKFRTRTGVTETASRGRKIARTENFNAQDLILLDFGLQNTFEVGFNFLRFYYSRVYYP